MLAFITRIYILHAMACRKVFYYTHFRTPISYIYYCMPLCAIFKKAWFWKVWKVTKLYTKYINNLYKNICKPGREIRFKKYYFLKDSFVYLFFIIHWDIYIDSSPSYFDGVYLDRWYWIEIIGVFRSWKMHSRSRRSLILLVTCLMHLIALT